MSLRQRKLEAGDFVVLPPAEHQQAKRAVGKIIKIEGDISLVRILTDQPVFVYRHNIKEHPRGESLYFFTKKLTMWNSPQS